MADHDEPKWHRLSFQEAMELSRLPDRTDGAGKTIQRFMSHRPAWKLGEELPRNVPLGDMAASVERFPGPGSYGGVVYTMSALAAARVVEEKDKEAALENKFAIHVRPRALVEALECVDGTDTPSTVNTRRLYKSWIQV